MSNATVIARQVASTPVRSAAETWATVVSIIAPDPNDAARAELSKVGGVAASLISSEAPKDDPVVVHGGGPRVRVYCVFGDDASVGDNMNEDPVRQSVTGSGWRMSLPCPADDLEWVQRKLKTLSARVTARALGESVPDDEGQEKGSKKANAAAAASDVPTVNVKEFFKS